MNRYDLFKKTKDWVDQKNWKELVEQLEKEKEVNQKAPVIFDARHQKITWLDYLLEHDNVPWNVIEKALECQYALALPSKDQGVKALKMGLSMYTWEHWLESEAHDQAQNKKAGTGLQKGWTYEKVRWSALNQCLFHVFKKINSWDEFKKAYQVLAGLLKVSVTWEQNFPLVLDFWMGKTSIEHDLKWVAEVMTELGAENQKIMEQNILKKIWGVTLSTSDVHWDSKLKSRWEKIQPEPYPQGRPLKNAMNKVWVSWCPVRDFEWKWNMEKNMDAILKEDRWSLVFKQNLLSWILEMDDDFLFQKVLDKAPHWLDLSVTFREGQRMQTMQMDCDNFSIQGDSQEKVRDILFWSLRLPKIKAIFQSWKEEQEAKIMPMLNKQETQECPSFPCSWWSSVSPKALLSWSQLGSLDQTNENGETLWHAMVPAINSLNSNTEKAWALGFSQYPEVMKKKNKEGRTAWDEWKCNIKPSLSQTLAAWEKKWMEMDLNETLEPTGKSLRL